MRLVLLFVLLLGASQAWSHAFIVNPGPDEQVVFGGTTPVSFTGSSITIRVRNGAGEGTAADPCTTRVTANRIGGNSVTFQNNQTAFLVEYTTPTQQSTDFQIFPVPNVSGGAVVQVNWNIIENGENCSGGATANFNLTVRGGVVTFTMAELKNQYSVGDPVALATGELHDAAPAVDLDLGGALPLRFLRFYAANLVNDEHRGAMGDGWVHSFNVNAFVVADTVTVGLFGGQTVAFEDNGSTWQLTNTEQVNYQLQDTLSGGYIFADPTQNRLYEFNSSGRLIAVHDRSGNTLTVTQGADGPTQVSDGNGRTLTFTYASGNLTRVQDHTGRNVQFGYAGGLLTSFTDPAGSVTAYAYTSTDGFDSLMTQATLPDTSVPFAQTFDASGRVVSQSDANANAVTFQYEQGAGADETNVVDARSNTKVYRHSAAGSLTEATDADGNSEAFTYDANDRLATITNRRGHTAQHSYDASSGLLQSYTDFSGATWSTTYTGQAQDGFDYRLPGTQQYPDGASRSFAYDANGRLTQFADRAGENWNLTYNAAGQPLSVTNPEGGGPTYTYNADGTLASESLSGGVTMTYGYDGLSRLTMVTHADASQSAYTYDPRDLLTQVTDEAGRVYGFSYDSNGRLATATDPSGNSHTYAYDGDSRLASLTDRTGAQETFSYDNRGQLSGITNGAGESVQWAYDARGLLSTVSDGEGTAFSYRYDRAGKLSAVVDGNGDVSRFRRDAMDRVTRIILPEGEQIDMQYDSVGRLTARDFAGLRQTLHTYDARGNLLTTDQDGLLGQYVFNSLGLLEQVVDPGGNQWSRGYDGDGRLVSVMDPLGQSVSFSYDNRGRRSQTVTPLGTNTTTHNAVGRVTRADYYDSSSRNHTYDANHRLVSSDNVALVRDAESRITGSNGLIISYDNAGRQTAVEYDTGQTVSYSYDSRGRLTGVSDWLSGDTTFTYDAADRLVRIDRPNGADTTFEYDANGSITRVQHVGIADINVVRDALGRAVSSSGTALPPTLSAATEQRTYDAASQVAGATYDALGRLENDGTNQFVWNADGTLSSATTPAGAISYTYDGLGSRISRVTGTGTETFTVNYATPLPTVAVSSVGAQETYFVYTPGGRLLYAIDPTAGSRSHYHFDYAGSAVALTNDAGGVTDRYGVSPFGEVITQQGTSPQPFVFQGAMGVMHEAGTSLYYMRFRYYDAASGRFLSRDPVLLLNPRGLNPYQFAYNSPLEYHDATGMSPFRVGQRFHAVDRPQGVPDRVGILLDLTFSGDRSEGGLEFGSAVRGALDNSQSGLTGRVDPSRFRVEVAFTDYGSTSQHADRLVGVDYLLDTELGPTCPDRPGDDLFYFFNSNDYQQLINVLDRHGSTYNHFWVFHAATTNVEYELTVTDTEFGTTHHSRVNPLGSRFEPITDTQAFATCP